MLATVFSILGQLKKMKQQYLFELIDEHLNYLINLRHYSTVIISVHHFIIVKACVSFSMASNAIYKSFGLAGVTK